MIPNQRKPMTLDELSEYISINGRTITIKKTHARGKMVNKMKKTIKKNGSNLVNMTVEDYTGNFKETCEILSKGGAVHITTGSRRGRMVSYYTCKYPTEVPGYDLVKMNDAPRGGQLGNYIAATKSGDKTFERAEFVRQFRRLWQKKIIENTPKYFYRVIEYAIHCDPDGVINDPIEVIEDFRDPNLEQCRIKARTRYLIKGKEALTNRGNRIYAVSLYLVEYYNSNNYIEHLVIGENDALVESTAVLENRVFKHNGYVN